MFAKNLQRRLAFRRCENAANRLRQVDPEQLAKLSERKLLAAFHRAAVKVPAYAELLRQHGVSPSQISSIEQFKAKVPVIDKSVFVENELSALCVDRRIDDISLFWSSSGHSGIFSYGVETPKDLRKTIRGIEFVMHNAFGAMRKRTLLINCLPMGVKIPSRFFPLAETAVRADVVWSLVKKLKTNFELFVLIGEQLFLKKVVEEGADQGVPWREIPVSFLTGAEYIAENYRSYLASLVGMDLDQPSKGNFWVNFGLSELSLTIFSEQPNTARIRRAAVQNRDLRIALCETDAGFCPNVMQYYPDHTFIETIDGEDGPELVVSLLDPTTTIPLIRYNTRDIARILSHERLVTILSDFGMTSLIPPFRLPMGVVWGKRKVLRYGPHAIAPEHVKEALYADHTFAGSVTGNFRLQAAKEGPQLLIQLRKGQNSSPDLGARLSNSLRQYTALSAEISLLPYEMFPHGMELDYERKPKYI